MEMLAAEKTGPMPTGKKWRGLPVPYFFQEVSAEAFQTSKVLSDDVVCSSPVKAGTSWLHKILALMLHGLDDKGAELVPSDEALKEILQVQVYPDALPMEVPQEQGFMGSWLSYQMLTQMPSPRLFTTHLFGELLPKQLMDPGGQGRLIVCLRNPKDVLTSLHFFRGAAQDGWLGNEHGPGSLARFCSSNSPNAYGSYFTWLLATERCTEHLRASGRCLVVYYEHLQDNLPRELERIAVFLRVPLSPAKRDALAAAVSFAKMAGHLTQRKGVVGDWKNHLDDHIWQVVDETVSSRLAGCKLYEPLARYAQR